ncbi:MAG: nuclear transport factor 2 family protein, partial [Pseudomonadota bacterium]
HMRGTPIITINGQSATAISNGYAYNKMSGAPDGSGDLWEVWGNYTHTFTRTDAGWKVSGFAFDMTHERGSSWVKSTPGS